MDIASILIGIFSIIINTGLAIHINIKHTNITNIISSLEVSNNLNMIQNITYQVLSALSDAQKRELLETIISELENSVLDGGYL